MMGNLLIASAWKQISLVRDFIREIKEIDDQIKIYTCDMNVEKAFSNTLGDGCFKVPICMSEDYVETIWSLCIEYNIGHIITMTEKEFIIMSANKNLFAKYGVQVMNYRTANNSKKIIQELQLNNRM